jgi:hypothetical protein
MWVGIVAVPLLNIIVFRLVGVKPQLAITLFDRFYLWVGGFIQQSLSMSGTSRYAQTDCRFGMDAKNWSTRPSRC